MKIDNYTLLTVDLHRLYPNYSYEVVPEIIRKLQQRALIVAMRVVKSALSMKN